jgi:UDP-glucuronate 4-epimerase
MGGSILVTGAAGLVGHAVRRRLEVAGRPILAVDSDAGEIEGYPVLGCDVTDMHGLHALASQVPITGIIHCGAFSGPMVAADRPLAIVDVNIGGTANILELARQVGNVRVVFCSSTSAVGPTPVGLSPVPEAVPLNPTTVYGASKAAGENLVAAYRRQFGVDGVSLRLSWVYGPRRRTSCAIRRLLADAISGRVTRIEAGADVPRQYLHVEDAADALVRALDHPRLPQAVYSIAGEWWGDLRDLASAVQAVIAEAAIELGDAPDPEDWQAAFDTSAAAVDFGWRPRITLEQGLRAYRDWLSAQIAGAM